MQYHINPETGNPGQCRAKKKCPFGDMTSGHFPTKEAAREAYEYAQSAGFTLQSETNGLTLKSYDKKINEYIAGSPSKVSPSMEKLMSEAFAHVPPFESITEIGAAFGRDTAYLQEKGFYVNPTDASDGFVQHLRENGFSRAEKLDIINDTIPPSGGVLANAVFLHFTKDEAERGFANVHEGLIPGGVFALTLKEGDGEEWSTEKLDSPRFFKYWREPELRESLKKAGFNDVFIEKDSFGAVTWLQVQARKEEKPSAYGNYRLQHQPSETGAQGQDLNQAFPDIYERPELYHFGSPAYDESIRVIKQMKDNPEEEITIYRAVPKKEYGIQEGNWVTISKSYAKTHAMVDDNPENDWPIVSMKVKAKDIRNPGDDINEWGYFKS